MNPNPCDRLLRVRGTVQGVGFRPFVLRLANELGVRGWVRNDSAGVLIRAVAPTEALDNFVGELSSRAPAAAHVRSITGELAEAALPEAGASFSIIESAIRDAVGETGIPVDLAPCSDCRRELGDPADRRQGYPFINCTQCGPRYSIIEALPYDRERTTMRSFPMCPECGREYGQPLDRRFHAEPNACPVCGPQLSLCDAAGNEIAAREEALAQTVAALCAGRIVAVKGVGGFHLMVDAGDEAAVADLRRRKQREEKPFAVMFADLAMLRAVANVSPAAEVLLSSPEAPIVLVPRRAESSLATSVAPGNPWIGALLPSSPLHLRLLAAVRRPLVATSANLSDEPLCTDDTEARERLEAIADLFLGHNREIARPVDDSVVRFTSAGAKIVLRRARGYAPAPLALPSRLPGSLLCVGAHMKNTVAVAAGDRVVLSPHIGDLGGVATRRVFERTIGTLGAIGGDRFGGVVHDKHPDYASTRYAENCGLPRLAVQHHLAHVLAVLLEHHHPAAGVLGVSWDGTGYGEDGTVWGGEFILLQGGRASRFARLLPFPLIGGEAAVRDARRVALALGVAVAPDSIDRVAAQLGFTPNECANLGTMLARGLNTPQCSSVGRLFDGVGALLDLGRHNSYEGQTPLAVEAAASRCLGPATTLPFTVRPAAKGALWDVDWRPAIEAVLHAPELDAAATAAAFHHGLVAALVETARHAGVGTVALSGGCFQNALLRHLAETALTAAGFTVLCPLELPPNDGAISAGQALAALWNLTTVELPPTT